MAVMKCVLPIVAVVLLAVNGAAGLRCYACMPTHQIGDKKVPASITDSRRGLPLCSAMDPKDPSLQFEMKCPPGLDGSCMKIRDEHGNELRSCSRGSSSKCVKQSNSGQVLCTCKGDFCNGATPSMPTLATLFVPLAAALLRLG